MGYTAGDLVALKSGLKGRIVRVIEASDLAHKAFYEISTSNGTLKLDGLHIVGLIGPQLLARLNGLPARVVHWFAKAEANYGHTLFYSSDIENMDKERRSALTVTPKALGVDAPARIKLSDIKIGQLLKVTQNGTADGFIGVGKNFSLNMGTRPSDAVRSFIDGRLTVCECEGMMYVVYLNAICDLLGDSLFDCVFQGLSVVQGGNQFTNFFDKLKLPAEAACQSGDWVYYVHSPESGAKFRQLVAANKKGGAASGWNLLCATQNPNTYYGFGLVNAQGAAHPLATVRTIMIRECGGDPADRDWALYLAFRRRLSGARLQTWVDAHFT
jgi:hypothetical protein